MTTQTRYPAELDHDLRHIADLIIALPELPGPVDTVVLINAEGDAETAKATVDAFAASLGVTASWDQGDGEYARYSASLRPQEAPWGIVVSTFLRRPETETERLRAQVAHLQAELAAARAQGHPATSDDPGPVGTCPRCDAQPGEHCKSGCSGPLF